MPKLRVRIRCLAFLCLAALCMAGLRDIFKKPDKVWSLDENLQGWKIPAYKNAHAVNTALSADGILIGAEKPGYAQWDFSDKTKGARAYSLRFEGRNAVLGGVRFYQPRGEASPQTRIMIIT